MHSTGSWEEIKWEAVGKQAFDEDTRRQACSSAIVVQGLRIGEFNVRMEKGKDPGYSKVQNQIQKNKPFFYNAILYCIVFVYEHVPKMNSV